MALSTYDDLQSAIVEFSLEISASDPIKMFISLAEGDVFPQLKHYSMETTVELSTTDNAVELPDDVSELRVIRVDGVIAKPVSVYGAQLYAGQIGYFQSGDALVFVPAIDKPRAVELTYYATPAALSDDNQSNWLLRKFPAVYLHSALARAYRWRQNPQAEQGEEASVSKALSLLALDHKKKTQGGNTIIIDGGNPYVA